MRSRTTVALAGTVAAAAAAVTAPVVSAPAATALASKPRVIAMGDSYASGEGLWSYDANSNRWGNQCHRSLSSWQRQLDWGNGLGKINEQNPRYDYRQVACSGATTTNISRHVRQVTPVGRSRVQKDEPAYQMDVLNGHESLVLLSIGGNDMGFEKILSTCSLGSVASCKGVVNTYAAKVGAVGGNVEAIVREIHRRSPYAKIVLAGYPFVVDTPSNPAGYCTGIESADAKPIRDLTNALNNEYARRVATMRRGGVPVRYANTAYAWVHTDGRRHDACVSGTNWINPLLISPRAGSHMLQIEGTESYHPNRAGHAAYTRVATAALRS